MTLYFKREFIHYSMISGLLCCFFAGHAAIADDQPIIVMLATRPNQATFDQVTESMEAQFAGSPVRFNVSWIDKIPARLPDQEQLAAKVAHDTGALAVLWVDLEMSERVYFYLTMRSSPKVLVRRLDGTGEEGLADALALICKSAVDSMLAGETIGFTPPPSAQTPTAQAAAPFSTDTAKKQGQETHVFADIAYAMSIPSAPPKIQNGAHLAVSALFKNRLRIFAGYTFCQSMEDSNRFAKLTLQRHPIHAGVAARFKLDRWSFEGSISMAIDYMTRMAQRKDLIVTVENPYGHAETSIIPAIRAMVDLRGSVSLFLNLGAEIHLVKHKWILENGPEFFTDLLRIQPQLSAGVQISLF